MPYDGPWCGGPVRTVTRATGWPRTNNSRLTSEAGGAALHLALMHLDPSTADMSRWDHLHDP